MMGLPRIYPQFMASLLKNSEEYDDFIEWMEWGRFTRTKPIELQETATL